MDSQPGSATLDDALALAVEQFRGIPDKAGQPYILHLLRVMLRQSDPLACQVGVLHDLIEDTEVSLDDLRRRGFAPEVVDAVDALTHREHEEYYEYVLRLAECPLARPVKLADLEDNYSLERVAYRAGHQTEDAARIQRYILSTYFLKGLIDRATYIDSMRRIGS